MCGTEANTDRDSHPSVVQVAALAAAVLIR